MKLVQYMEYFISTVGTDGLGLQHQGISDCWIPTHVFPVV